MKPLIKIIYKKNNFKRLKIENENLSLVDKKKKIYKEFVLAVGTTLMKSFEVKIILTNS